MSPAARLPRAALAGFAGDRVRLCGGVAGVAAGGLGTAVVGRLTALSNRRRAGSFARAHENKR